MSPFWNPYGYPPYPPPFQTPTPTAPYFPKTKSEMKEMIRNYRMWQKFTQEEEELRAKKEKEKKDKSTSKVRTFTTLEVFALLTVLGPFVSLGYAYAITTVMQNMSSILK